MKIMTVFKSAEATVLIAFDPDWKKSMLMMLSEMVSDPSTPS